MKDFLIKGASGTIEYVPIHLRVCYDKQTVDAILGRDHQDRQIPPVLQIAGGDVVGEFVTSVEAARETGVSLDGIRRVLQG